MSSPSKGGLAQQLYGPNERLVTSEWPLSRLFVSIKSISTESVCSSNVVDMTTVRHRGLRFILGKSKQPKVSHSLESASVFCALNFIGIH